MIAEQIQRNGVASYDNAIPHYKKDYNSYVALKTSERYMTSIYFDLQE